jgi:hypothetical protein
MQVKAVTSQDIKNDGYEDWVLVMLTGIVAGLMVWVCMGHAWHFQRAR